MGSQMIHEINEHKLEMLPDATRDYARPDLLQRVGKVFFIGGNLPVYSTLETMYESYCQESSELFHVSFGDPGQFEHNLELVRQIKRNFSIRLMGRVNHLLSPSQIERAYLAGLDILDISESLPDSDSGSRSVTGEFKAATATFTHWSVTSTIPAGRQTLHTVRSRIEELLHNEVIPLLDITGTNNLWHQDEVRDLYTFLAAQWHQHRVPLKPIMPLLRLTTPFVLAESTGYLRDVMNRLHDKHSQATSDLRRHLRTRGAEASFESAGL
jgi:hypothetical protein